MSLLRAARSAAPVPPPTGSAALAPRERLWELFDITTTYGSLDLPPVADLRAAAALLARQWPELRLGQRLDRARQRWVDTGVDPEEAGAEAVVVHDGPSAAEVGPSAHLREVVHLRPGDVPLRFAVTGGDHLTLLMSHALGDARIATGSVRALVHTAQTGVVPAWATERATPRPLRSALRHQFVGDLAQVRRTAAAARPSLRRPPAPATADRGLVRPDPDMVHRLMTTDGAAVLRAWRAEHASGASMVAVHAVLLERAMHREGLPPRGGPTVLFDARRYLPAGAVVHGNFVAGIALPASERWQVRDLHDQIQVAADAARPLTAMTVGAAVHAVRALGPSRQGSGAGAAGAPAVEWPVEPGARPVVALSSVRVAALRSLPWTRPPQERRIASLLTAAPAEGATLSSVELDGCLHMSLSFHRSVFDPQRMARVLDLVARHPLELLEDRS